MIKHNGFLSVRGGACNDRMIVSIKKLDFESLITILLVILPQTKAVASKTEYRTCDIEIKIDLTADMMKQEEQNQGQEQE